MNGNPHVLLPTAFFLALLGLILGGMLLDGGLLHSHLEAPGGAVASSPGA